MGANERLTHPPRRPRFQHRPQASPNLRQIAELFVEVSRLSAHELEDMRAGSATRPPDRNYLLDLLQREAEPSGLHDKRDDRTRVISIDTVACRGTPRCLENACRLVQTQRFAADAAPGGDLTDEQAVSCHDQSLNPAPWGKVKSLIESFGFQRRDADGRQRRRGARRNSCKSGWDALCLTAMARRNVRGLPGRSLALFLLGVSAAATLLLGTGAPHLHVDRGAGFFNEEHDLTLFASSAVHAPLPVGLPVITIGSVVVLSVTVLPSRPVSRPGRLSDPRAPPLA